MREGRPLWWVVVLPLVIAACEGESTAQPEVEPGPQEATGENGTALRLTPEERERRKERIRAYFRARRERLPIVATTRTNSGQIIDWVPRPNDRLAPPPPDEEPPTSEERPETLERSPGLTSVPVRTEVQAQPWARGPEGTVPVVRFDVESYLATELEPPENPEDVLAKLPAPSPSSNGRYYAVWTKQSSTSAFYGTAGFINIWNTTDLAAKETSIGQVAVIRGSPMQAIEAGKIEGLGGTTWPRFFVYFRTNGGAQGNWVGGYNDYFDGWQQVSSTVSPGMSLENWKSVAGGTQYDLNIRVRIVDGNWWVWAAGEWAGYYPRCKYDERSPTCATKGYLFSTNGLRSFANRLDWFGEVYDASAPAPTITDMGSGRFASAGLKYAAYFRNLTYYSTAGSSASSLWTSTTRSPFATDAGCYSVSGASFSSDERWRNWFLWGGPGKGAANCN
jgi:hypothetical protein